MWIALRSSQELTFAVLALSVLVLWWRRDAALLGLLTASVIGSFAGVLDPWAWLWMGLLALACAVERLRRFRPVAIVLITMLCLGLALHQLPGFHNLLLFQDVRLTPDSAPYSLPLNFDKTAAGLLVLALCCPPPMRWPDLVPALRRSVLPIGVLLLVILAVSMAAGYVRWHPKWRLEFLPFAVVNLLSTCLAEETFFRAFLQQRLTQCWQNRRYGVPAAILVSSLLFGLAHAASGPAYVALASVAGVGYGTVYYRSGRIEMSMLAHFTLNATHFLLFTYPFWMH